MGLSIVISGIIVLMTLMYVLMNIPGFLVPILSVEETSSEVSILEKSISQTDISIVSIDATPGSARIDFTLNNEGEEKLWDFEKFNLIITYDESSDRLTEELTYDGDCGGGVPSAGNWCIEAISGDFVDPNVLNNGESASIRTQVSQNVASGIVIVLVSANNGVVTTLSTTT